MGVRSGDGVHRRPASPGAHGVGADVGQRGGDGVAIATPFGSEGPYSGVDVEVRPPKMHTNRIERTVFITCMLIALLGALLQVLVHVVGR